MATPGPPAISGQLNGRADNTTFEQQPAHDHLRTQRELLQGYPLAAGLTPITEVITGIPLITPFPPTLFPLSPTSLTAGPDEPLFDQYAQELSALLASGPVDAETEAWRQAQLDRVVSEVAGDVDVLRGPAYGGLRFPPAPDFPTVSLSSPPPLPSATASYLLTSLAFPPPPPRPSSLPSTMTSSAAQAFFDASLAQPPEALPAAASPISLASASPNSSVNVVAATSTSKERAAPPREPDSSPDPLRIVSTRHPKLVSRACERETTPPAPVSPTSSRSSPRMSFAVEIPPSTIKNRGSFTSVSSRKSLTESQRARLEDETPEPADFGLGVESAVKRIKLSGSASLNGSTGSGHGVVRSSGTTDVVDKFTDFVQDLFSADDAFIDDTSGAHVSTHSTASTRSFFQTATAAAADNSPLLATGTLQKILKHVATITTKGKGDDLLEELEQEQLGRLLRILERSWRGVEDASYWEPEALRPKPEAMEAAPWKKKGKKAKSAAKRGAGRRTPNEDDGSDEEEYDPGRRSPSAGERKHSRSRSPTVRVSADVEMETDEGDGFWTGDAVLSFQRATRNLSDALLAVQTALSLLTVTLLPKRVYSSDYIASIVVLLRHALDAFIVPFLEAAPHSYLDDLLVDQQAAIATVSDAFELAFEPLGALVSQEEMSEDIVISIIYFSLEPFFHEASVTSGRGKKAMSAVAKAMKSIRMASLSLVRTVLGRYPDQRGWVVDEVMTRLTKLEVAKKGKGGYRLRNGATIHTVSALILHLVQTVPSDISALMKSRLSQSDGPSLVDVVMRDSQTEDDKDDVDGEENPLVAAARDVLDPMLEFSAKSARTVINTLLQKSCKAGKIANGSTESEYRAVLDNLIADLLATLHLPEWPGSEVLLTVCCRSMLSTFGDAKNTYELSALKGMSLDHLGPIAARIRQELTEATIVDGSLKTLHEIVATNDVEALDALFASEVELLCHLARSEQSASSEGATQCTLALFGRDLLQASQAAAANAARFSEEERADTQQAQRAKLVAGRLAVLTRKIWMVKLKDDNVFGPSSDYLQPRIDSLAVQLSRSQPLATLYDSIVKQLVNASESTIVSLRTKSLRGISLIVAQDPELFLQDDIRTAIHNRILDSSPQVRDTALELVGKYVVKRQDLAMEYLPQISERITDTGLAVRRRVIKLLKALFQVIDVHDYRVDICRKLVWRVLDDDDGVKELAVDALEELWFGHALPATNGRAAVPEDLQTFTPAGPSSGISKLSAIIMAVTGVYKDRPPPVDAVLRQIISKHVEKGTKPPLIRLREVTESLIDALVEDEGTMSVVECIKTIFVLNSADPSLLTPAKATLLLPFLKSASTPAEQTTSDFLLRIFRSTVSALPKGSSKFSRDLQTALLPMVNRPPPSASTNTLQEIVSCLCAVVKGQTHEFSKLITIFRACAGRLGSALRLISDPATCAQVNRQSLPMLCYLTALLCEHGGFDKMRIEFPETRPELDAIMTSSISDYVFTVLIKFYNTPLPPATQAAIRTSLGFLYRAYPTLMLKPASTSMLDAVFASADLPARLQVLKVFQDFLASQARPEVAPPPVKTKAQTGVKIEELVGNVEGFADSGVASAIAQRYIDQIITLALSTQPQVQRVAVDILTSVARSGFSHPLTIAPPLIALAGAPDAQIASKSHSTLAVLHQKHASLLATRYLASVRTVHAYAHSMAKRDDVVNGYVGDPPVSYLARWYGLLKEKRQYQLEFLKSLSRLFELELDSDCSENDVSFARFVAEILSTIEYKRMEEPMLIIHYLNAALAVSGLEVVHSLEEGLKGGGGLMAGIVPIPVSPPKLRRNGSSSPGKRGGFNGPSSLQPVPEPALLDLHTEDGSEPPLPRLARQSLICGLALLLRDHLKQLYGITDVRLSKFKIGKKSPAGDKATIPRPDAPLALGLDGYERMPLTLQRMDTAALLVEQRNTYISLIQADGTIGTLELEVDDDDE